jgi:hypothetical protein
MDSTGCTGGGDSRARFCMRQQEALLARSRRDAEKAGRDGSSRGDGGWNAHARFAQDAKTPRPDEGGIRPPLRLCVSQFVFFVRFGSKEPQVSEPRILPSTMPPAGTVAATGNTPRCTNRPAYVVRASLASSPAVPFNTGFCLTRSREGREELVGWGVPQSRRLSTPLRVSPWRSGEGCGIRGGHQYSSGTRRSHFGWRFSLSRRDFSG